MLKLLMGMCLVCLGAALGVVLLCLLQAGSRYDRDIEKTGEKKEIQ